MVLINKIDSQPCGALPLHYIATTYNRMKNVRVHAACRCFYGAEWLQNRRVVPPANFPNSRFRLEIMWNNIEYRHNYMYLTSLPNNRMLPATAPSNSTESCSISLVCMHHIGLILVDVIAYFSYTGMLLLSGFFSKFRCQRCAAVEEHTQIRKSPDHALPIWPRV